MGKRAYNTVSPLLRVYSAKSSSQSLLSLFSSSELFGNFTPQPARKPKWYARPCETCLLILCASSLLP